MHSRLTPDGASAPGSAFVGSLLALAVLLQLAACNSDRSSGTTLTVIARAALSDPQLEVDPEVLLAAREAEREDSRTLQVPCEFRAESRRGDWTALCPAPTHPLAWNLVMEFRDLLQTQVRIVTESPPCVDAPPLEIRRSALLGEKEIYVAPLPTCAGRSAEPPLLRFHLRGVGQLGTQGTLLAAELRRIRPRALLARVNDPVRIRLRNDWRIGFVDRGEIPVAREEARNGTAQLRTAAAVVGDSSCRITVVAEASGVEKILLEQRLPGATREREFAWTEFAVPLGESLPGGGMISLNSHCDFDRGLSLIAWGAPTIVALDRGERLPNVVLVSIDTLRADHLGAYGYSRRTSPRLDRWISKNATLFEEATAAAPWTYPSHVSMFTGIDAVRHGAYFGDQPRDLRPLEPLALKLRELGYTTLAVTGGGFVSAELGFASGFDLYRSWADPTTRDQELDGNLRFLEERIAQGVPRPYLLFFHTYEVHNPNRPRQPFFSEFSASPPGLEVIDGPAGAAELRNGFRPTGSAFIRHEDGRTAALDEDSSQLPVDLYDSAIRYMDERIGELLENLAAIDPERRTIVVLTSDHGESFGELGHYWHGFLDEPNLRVPLAIQLPGGAASGRRVSTPVRLVDVAPTILDLVRGEIPRADGRSLTPFLSLQKEVSDRPSWAYAASNNHGLALRVPGRRKFVFLDAAWPPIAGSVEQFDLRGVEAPARGEPASVTDSFRAMAVEKLDNDLVGVHILIENHTRRTLHIGLAQGFLGPSTLKLLDPNAAVEWQGPGRARVAVGHDSRTRLVLLRAAPDDFDLRAQLDEPACGRSAPVTLLGVALDPLESRVIPLPCGGAAGPEGATVQLRAADPHGDSGSELSQDLARELRALGYLR